jgi:predicted RNase H-like HicB family nuclease
MLKDRALTYTVLFEHADEGGYIAFVPTLPGCMTQGETFEETKNNIQDAIAAYITVLQEDGDDVPVEHAEHIAATVAVALPV